MFSEKTVAAFSLMVVLCCGPLAAQSPEMAAFDPPVRLPATDLGPAAEVATLPERGPILPDNVRQPGPVAEEMKKWAWRKGDVTITPYGILWASMAYETERSKNTDYTLYVESPDVHGEPASSVDCKSTRLGFDVAGPMVNSGWLCGAKTGGKVEIDFQAPFQQRNKGQLMLRHCYLEAKTDEYRFLAGQTWDVVSPLGIPMLDYPAGSAVGSIGYRRAQFRAERFLAYSDVSMLTLQAALACNIVSDFLGDNSINGDQGPYPDIQGRAAWTLGERKGPDAAPIVVGFSGHIGEQSFDFRSPAPVPARNVNRRTWSMCGDFTVPYSKNFGLQGEVFTGENLSGYMGGVLQGINPYTLRTISATGGWGSVWWQATDPMRFNVGYAIDDPWNQEVAPGGRTYNEVIFTNVNYDHTKNLSTAFEISTWKTGWLNRRPGESVRFEFAAKYKF